MPPQKTIKKQKTPVNRLKTEKTKPANLETKIRQEAYYRYLKRGATNGNDQSDWFEAERELKSKY